MGVKRKYLKILRWMDSNMLLKEIFQPHLPVRLPCYDLALITSITLDSSLLGHHLQALPTLMA